MIDIVFLGTGGSMPTEGRNLPAIAIRYLGWIFLFDCGEDVQRQFERAGLGLNKNMSIFITHGHSDHLIGLPGLLLRFSLLGRLKPLTIYGPKELIEYVKISQSTINLGTTFETVVYGLTESGIVFQESPVTIRAFEVDHRGFALGYEVLFQNPTGEFIPEKAEELGVPKGPLWSTLAKGDSVVLSDGTIVNPEDVTGPCPRPLKIVYSGDTRPCQALRETSKDADVLISEAMYTAEHADLAQERGHSTAEDIAKMASEVGVRLLVLTHYSPRYYDGSAILVEGKTYFPNTILARDLLTISLDKEGAYSIKESVTTAPSRE
ncbi:MAG: ribonuclease Z [Candidatus Odinarchaeota archaeon]